MRDTCDQPVCWDHRLLVVDRGWSGSRFERWYGDTLERLLYATVDPV